MLSPGRGRGSVRSVGGSRTDRGMAGVSVTSVEICSTPKLGGGGQLRCRPGPVDVGPVGTELEILAESAGMEMKTPVEDQTESGKTDRGASQDWAGSSKGGVWE